VVTVEVELDQFVWSLHPCHGAADAKCCYGTTYPVQLAFKETCSSGVCSSVNKEEGQRWYAPTNNVQRLVLCSSWIRTWIYILTVESYTKTLYTLTGFKWDPANSRWVRDDRFAGIAADEDRTLIKPKTG
jgi:hypothetical protein